MLCERCQQKQATVHMQQIFNGEKTEVHVCQDCAGQMDFPISFDHIFHGFLDSMFSAGNMEGLQELGAKKLMCEACGMTYEDIKKSGRLGCENCYHAFRKELDSILRNVQGSNQHEGKFPKRAGLDLYLKREIDKLKLEQLKAIENEEYEEAARIRDLIKQRESEARRLE